MERCPICGEVLTLDDELQGEQLYCHNAKCEAVIAVSKTEHFRGRCYWRPEVMAQFRATRARLIAEAVKPYENCVAAAAPHYCATSCTDHNYPDCAKAWPECDILAARKALAAKD